MTPRKPMYAAAIALGLAGLVNAATPMFSRSPVEQALAIASDRLDLQPAQQAALMPLLERAVALRGASRDDMDRILDASHASLASPDADLRKLSGDAQAVVDARLVEARELRADFLAYYETQLTPVQQAQVRERLAARLDRFERLRDAVVALRADPLLPID